MYICAKPFTSGQPTYCLMSARSRNAESIDEVRLLVVRIKTLGCLRIWSSWVSTAFTTRMESVGSFAKLRNFDQINEFFKCVIEFDLHDELRANAIDSTSSIRTHTKCDRFSTTSLILSKSFITSFPLYTNQKKKISENVRWFDQFRRHTVVRREAFHFYFVLHFNSKDYSVGLLHFFVFVQPNVWKIFGCKIFGGGLITSKKIVFQQNNPRTMKLNLEKRKKKFPNQIPTSENHFENRLWELISMRCVYLNVSFMRIEIFWAIALHKLVFPVPGGPCSKIKRLHDITFGLIPHFENTIDVSTNWSS